MSSAICLGLMLQDAADPSRVYFIYFCINAVWLQVVMCECSRVITEHYLTIYTVCQHGENAALTRRKPTCKSLKQETQKQGQVLLGLIK